MKRAMFFALGLLLSVLGGGLIFLGWYDYQQVQAAYLGCEYNHPPNVTYSCYGIWNGAWLAKPMQEWGFLLIVLGIAVIVLGFFRKRVTQPSERTLTLPDRIEQLAVFVSISSQWLMRESPKIRLPEYGYPQPDWRYGYKPLERVGSFRLGARREAVSLPNQG
jgi:uncharacterized membrane protein